MTAAYSSDHFSIDADFISRFSRLEGTNVRETHWGYVIKGTEAEHVRVRAAQAASCFMGGAFLISAVALWIFPSRALAAGFELHLTLTCIFLAVGYFLVRYGTRGTLVEIEVDLNAKELREVVRNRAGRPSLLGKWSFDSFGGLFIDRSKLSSGEAALMLRYRGTATVVEVASGPLPRIENLRDRLGRDVFASQLR